MGQNTIEICPAFINHGRKADNLRASTYDNQKFELVTVGKRNVAIVHNANIAFYSIGSK